ncbi:MAG: hypothetical protein ACYC99_04355 [Candidatus Geothermincolia bacterium]
MARPCIQSSSLLFLANMATSEADSIELEVPARIAGKFLVQTDWYNAPIMICPKCSNEYDETLASSCPYCAPSAVKKRETGYPVLNVAEKKKPKTELLAILSIAVATCFWIGAKVGLLLGPILSGSAAIVIGIAAKIKIKNSKEELAGRNLSTIGIALGCLTLVAVVFVAFAYENHLQKTVEYAKTIMVFSSQDAALVRSGVKTQKACIDDRYQVGSIVGCKDADSQKADFAQAKIMSSRPVKMGDLSAEDLRKEGYASTEQFRVQWDEWYPPINKWNPDRTIWLVAFQLQ